jgi:hypothetical protein
MKIQVTLNTDDAPFCIQDMQSPPLSLKYLDPVSNYWAEMENPFCMKDELLGIKRIECSYQ